VLLVTGLGANLDLGAPFERALAARGFQVISFDAPGVGQSTPYTVPRRMPGFARTVHRMVDKLGYHKVDVFGVSLGGVVAQQLARQSGNLVGRLILAATGPGLGGVPGSPRVLLTLATPRRYYQPDYYRRVAGQHLRRRGPPGPGRTAARLGGALRRTALDPWLPRPDLRHQRLDQPAVAAPAAAAHPGARRRRRPRRALINGHILARRIPRARLEIIRGGGHLFMLERPAEVAALVADFLSVDSGADADAGLGAGAGAGAETATAPTVAGGGQPGTRPHDIGTGTGTARDA
jgi:pimeloyl-ACP methyl ester carboxylesterase